jgi:hypothetical protein
MPGHTQSVGGHSVHQDYGGAVEFGRTEEPASQLDAIGGS